MISDLERDLLETWRRWQRSIEERDAATAGEILDADYHLEIVRPTRAVHPRAEWLGALGGYVVHSYDIAESVVSIDGDTAVILHRAQQQATVFGSDRSGEFVISDVWRRRDGRWRVWRRHSTPLTAGAMSLQPR